VAKGVQPGGREPSACGNSHSLLHSARNDRDCRASFYAVRYVARRAGSGSSDSGISLKLQQRFREPRVPYLDVSQAPSLKDRIDEELGRQRLTSTHPPESR
jgi:hypothetical protein